MNDARPTLLVRVNVELTPETLQTIVQNAKEMAGSDEKGVYHVDTADSVSEMITRFLQERDFEAYVKDISNYSR